MVLYLEGYILTFDADATPTKIDHSKITASEFVEYLTNSVSSTSELIDRVSTKAKEYAAAQSELLDALPERPTASVEYLRSINKRYYMLFDLSKTNAVYDLEMDDDVLTLHMFNSRSYTYTIEIPRRCRNNIPTVGCEYLLKKLAKTPLSRADYTGVNFGTDVTCQSHILMPYARFADGKVSYAEEWCEMMTHVADTVYHRAMAEIIFPHARRVYALAGRLRNKEKI